MFCKNCGKDIGDELICPECGTDNGETSAVVTQQAPVVSEQPKDERKQKSNICAILGFAWSFYMPLLGVILGIVGLAKQKEYTDPNKGLGIAAVIIGGLQILSSILLVVIVVALIVPLVPQLTEAINSVVGQYV